jgi:class 3 adenylate cyclase
LNNKEDNLLSNKEDNPLSNKDKLRGNTLVLINKDRYTVMRIKKLIRGSVTKGVDLEKNVTLLLADVRTYTISQRLDVSLRFVTIEHRIR